ncbi:hypothetical protein FAGKG844_20220 [Frankia sp. AgKG'84/4]
MSRSPQAIVDGASLNQRTRQHPMHNEEAIRRSVFSRGAAREGRRSWPRAHARRERDHGQWRPGR